MVIFELFYLLGVKAYGAGIFLLSFFNGKASVWIQGRKGLFAAMKQSLKPGEKRIWFHCPSLGEFEQGKPVLEALRKEYPDYKIVLTFFSPSGYEARRKYPDADYVYYLPLDGPFNSPRFINLVNPEMAFFVKYDFWHFYIKALKEKKIPGFVISCIFRPSQIYFKWYGFFFNKILRRINHFFVQNQASLELLYRHSLPSVTVSGDTRFDRVYENSLHPKEFPFLKKFKGERQLIVAGSTWLADEDLLGPLMRQPLEGLKWIVAPHEIHEHKINLLEKKLGDKVIRYSQVKDHTSMDSYNVVIIDNVGMLSSLYAYADVAYVGGGFGAGIHNILEAAVFGIPVLFGPRYEKFQEAKDLIARNGAFAVRNKTELDLQLHKLISGQSERNRIREVNKAYVQENKGATGIIMDYLRMNHPIS